MRVPTGNGAAHMLLTTESALTQYLRNEIAALGASVTEARELLIREFIYQGPDEDHEGVTWKTFVQTHICYVEVTFRDRIVFCTYWSSARQEPLTRAQARAELDLARLIPSDRTFWEQAFTTCKRLEETHEA